MSDFTQDESISLVLFLMIIAVEMLSLFCVMISGSFGPFLYWLIGTIIVILFMFVTGSLVPSVKVLFKLFK